MGIVVSLTEALTTSAVDQSLEAAPYHSELRQAATEVIGAVHGLPDIMDAQLGQIEVYIGRSGATPRHLKNRWSHRFEAFGEAPSTVALVVFTAPTDYVRGDKWERAAHLLINSLTKTKALCCANALTGESGRWPKTDDCAIYIVARLRKGPAGVGVSPDALNAAVLDLIHEDDLNARVVRAAARKILRPEEGIEHEFYEEYVDDGYEDAPVFCKGSECLNGAYPGNYGFCRLHRPYVGPGQRPCKVCGRPARVGNYGFCGRHRR